MLRLAAHTADEHYQRGYSKLEPLTAVRGTRTYIHAKPYILVPDTRLTAAFSTLPDAGGAIGRARQSEWAGMKGETVGQAQEWFYHEDRVLVLWECFLEDRYQTGEAPDDPNMRVLWEGFEHFLLGQFSPVRQLVTTADDPLYERHDYERFLGDLAYTRLSAGAFAKTRPIASGDTPQSSR